MGLLGERESGMTTAEFAAVSVALQGHGGRTHSAAYLVLVDGLTLGQASRQVDVERSSVSRLVARMRKLAADGCPTCGAPLI